MQSLPKDGQCRYSDSYALGWGRAGFCAFCKRFWIMFWQLLNHLPKLPFTYIQRPILSSVKSLILWNSEIWHKVNMTIIFTVVPTKLSWVAREHSGFVYSLMIRFIQYSWNCAFWTRNRSAVSWFYYTFSGLNNFDMRIEWKWSIFNPVRTPALIESGGEISRKCKTIPAKEKTTHTHLQAASYKQNTIKIEFFLALRKKFDFVQFCGHQLTLI